MSDSGKAVFLSYASQDTEAATRICEALRSAGVEVWFDQSELAGGDAWDAKIRGQIGSCALFMPVISANTQARLEGYFRIEWKIAARRTHAMATAKAFLLPIVIDDTHDASAHVPDEFRDVQWTRLKGGEAPPAFGARVKKLLDGTVAGVADPGLPGSTSPATSRTVPSRSGPSKWWWALPMFGVAMALALVMKEQRKEPAPVASPPDQRVIPPISEVRQLTARARALLAKPSMGRPELAAADDLCKRAAALDSNDADVWAAWASVHTWYVFHNFDSSAARRSAARDAAARAMQLDPKSFEARLAQALYWGRGEAFILVRENELLRPQLPEAERMLVQLLQEQPDEPRALFTLGYLYSRGGRVEEGLKLLERAAAQPAFAAVAWDEIGWYYLNHTGNYRQAEVAADKSLAAEAYWNNLALKIRIVFEWHGDLEAMKALLQQMPATALQEDWGTGLLVHVYSCRREPQEIVRFLETVPASWLSSNWYDGPKALLLADARAMGGQADAARREYRRALEQVEARLAGAPNDANLLAVKARCLLRLGEKAAATEAYRAYKELRPNSDFFLDLLFATPDQAFAAVEQRLKSGSWPTAASLRYQPGFDSVRGDPRFADLVRQAEADPRRSPKATTVPAPSSLLLSPSARPEVEPKSVAVLAFANLSDDKANEYFSDGISEELLNVLAKVPGLKVSARTSAFYFKGKEMPIPEIARQLGVAYVIEGSVRKQGSQVRIRAQLVKAADGFPVWSDTFTRDLKDIFAVQDEIAGLVAQQLQLKLGGTARTASPIKPEAFELYVQARRAWNLRNAAGFAEAEELLTRALTLEPNFARAHVALADVWMLRALANGVIDTFGQRTAPVFTQIVSEIKKALALDPDSSEAHASWGMIVRLQQWNLPEAERELRRSVELNPNYATAHHWLGICLSDSGRIDEGLVELRRAAELDPFSLRILEAYADGLVRAGRREEGLAVLGRAEALQVRAPMALLIKAEALLQLGRRAEAIALARELDEADRAELLARAGEKSEAEAALAEAEGWYRYQLLTALGRTAEALAALRAEDVAVAEVGNWLMDPALDPFRQEPHFVKLLETLGLTEAHARMQSWRAAHPPAKP